jgi:DsbC/DsbD-like thiol-disulfide interchange protein
MKRWSIVLLVISIFALNITAEENVKVNGYLDVDKARRGRVVQAAVVIDIPEGQHVNSNKPLGKYSIPTRLEITGKNGIRIGQIIYPKSVVRRFKFSKTPIAVYEGRAVIKFNVTIPATHPTGQTEVIGRLRYQACTDETCFPPGTKEIRIPVTIVNANESSKPINAQLFTKKS